MCTLPRLSITSRCENSYQSLTLPLIWQFFVFFFFFFLIWQFLIRDFLYLHLDPWPWDNHPTPPHLLPISILFLRRDETRTFPSRTQKGIPRDWLEANRINGSRKSESQFSGRTFCPSNRRSMSRITLVSSGRGNRDQSGEVTV